MNRRETKMQYKKRKAMRLERFTKRLREGWTRCPSCGNEMWFMDAETFDAFKVRSGIHADTSDEYAFVATLDHVVPMIKGGPNHHMNIIVICGQCNHDKADQDPEDWLKAVAERYPNVTQRFVNRTSRRIRTVRRKIRAIETKRKDQ